MFRWFYYSCLHDCIAVMGTHVLPTFYLCSTYVLPMCYLCSTYVLPMFYLRSSFMWNRGRTVVDHNHTIVSILVCSSYVHPSVPYWFYIFVDQFWSICRPYEYQTMCTHVIHMIFWWYYYFIHAGKAYANTTYNINIKYVLDYCSCDTYIIRTYIIFQTLVDHR